MAKIYARKIREALKENPDNPSYTIDDVPDRWRDEVIKILDGE